MELLNLPSCLTASLLSSWIEVDDMAKLDTAYSNRTLRPLFLATLRLSEFVLKETGRSNRCCNSAGWMGWHARRGVKAAVVTLRHDNIAEWSSFAGLVRAIAGVTLTTLVFDGTDMDLVPLFYMMAVNCCSVRNLCFDGCKVVTGVDVFLRSCSASLQAITLARSTLDMSDFSGIQLPNMRKLKLVGDCHDAESVCSVLRCCVGLSEVYLRCVRLSDACIEALEGHAASLTRLTILDPGTIRKVRNAGSVYVRTVSDAALVRLAQRCTNLASLHLTTPNLPVEVLETFFRAAPRLNSVTLLGSNTGETLKAVAVHCGSRLRHLRISVSDVTLELPGAIEALITHCTALESLCYYVDVKESTRDDGYLQLIAAQKELLSIDFADESVTDAHLKTVADNCPQLQEILLYDAKGYTAAGLIRVINTCKNLKRVQANEDDKVINEVVRLLWRQVNPRVCFDYTDSRHPCWRSEFY
jgi:hypothetical protein